MGGGPSSSLRRPSRLRSHLDRVMLDGCGLAKPPPENGPLIVIDSGDELTVEIDVPVPIEPLMVTVRPASVSPRRLPILVSIQPATYTTVHFSETQDRWKP